MKNLSENNLKHLLNLRDKFVNRNNLSLEKYYIKSQKVKNLIETKVKTNEEKAFKKYERWYYFLKKHKEDLKLKKDKTERKFIEKNEKLEEKEKFLQNKNEEIMQKLKSAEIKRKDLENKKAEHLLSLIEKDKERLNLLKQKKQNFKEIRLENSLILLDNQINLISKSNLKETSLNLNKLNV